jgi:hypothetical protein
VTTNLIPAIKIVKEADPTCLPVGGGTVACCYAVTNVGATPLSNVTVADGKCSPVMYLAGDSNNNAILDLTEAWTYSGTMFISQTTTKTVVATGHYVDPGNVDHT